MNKTNYAVIKFTNPVFIDIFGKCADNSDLADFISADGAVSLKLNTSSAVEPPKTVEQALSIMFRLIDENPQSAVGKIFAESRNQILSDTVFRLGDILDGFTEINMSVHTFAETSENSDKTAETTTTFTMTRTKN
ncbi:MAG: hypothetical protein MJ081_07730 [Ruminococcus sp.]|nr:hypothetical protein [Ruminococcus sp.]